MFYFFRSPHTRCNSEQTPFELSDQWLQGGNKLEDFSYLVYCSSGAELKLLSSVTRPLTLIQVKKNLVLWSTTFYSTCGILGKLTDSSDSTLIYLKLDPAHPSIHHIHPPAFPGPLDRFGWLANGTLSKFLVCGHEQTVGSSLSSSWRLQQFGQKLSILG